MVRPDVVWFGETLPKLAFQNSWDAARNSDAFISIGTSALVEPAASLPMVAYQNGATIIEINPNITPLTRYATYTFQYPSGIILPELFSATWGNK
jgi:NAD-dependent deacetylase